MSQVKPKSGRRWLRVSTLGAMVLVIAAAVPMGWLARGIREQREAVEAVRKFGGWVHYEHEFVGGKIVPGQGPAAPRWLIRLMGPEAFQNVRLVSLVYDDSTGKRFDNENTRSCEDLLVKVARLPGLKSLQLKESQATDGGLESIGRMTGLEEILIWDAGSVTDAGVAHLAGLSRLDRVHISGSKMTDESLVLLSGLPSIKSLSLQFSHFTDAGLARLQGRDRLTTLAIGLGDFRVTDAGVSHLSKFPCLALIDLQNSRVTDMGLESLVGLTKLTQLWLEKAPVTDEGVMRLKRAIPALKVNR